MEAGDCVRCRGRGEIEPYPLSTGSGLRLICDVCGESGKGAMTVEELLASYAEQLRRERLATAVAHDAAVLAAADRDSLASELAKLRDHVRSRWVVERVRAPVGGDGRSGCRYVVRGPDPSFRVIAEDTDPGRAIALAVVRSRRAFEHVPEGEGT